MLAVGGIPMFIFMGVAQGLYGPLLPQFSREFGVGAGALGLLYTAQGIGEILGIMLPTYLRAPMLSRAWLGISVSFLVTGFTGMSMAPDWNTVLACTFVTGLGFGIVIIRLNTLFVDGFGRRSLGMLQFLNAGYSVGTILGPLLAGLLHPPVRPLFAGISACAALLLPLGILAERHAMRRRGRKGASSGAGLPATANRRGVLAGFTVLMLLTIGVEQSIAGWLATLTIAAGHSAQYAAHITAIFFAFIFAGRLLAAFTSMRFDARFTVLSSLVGVAVCVALAQWPGAAPYGLALAGFAMAPFFSATLIWLGKAMPATPLANSLVISGAIAGSAIFPPLIGRTIDSLGTAVAPAAILVVALCGLLVCLLLRSRDR